MNCDDAAAVYRELPSADIDVVLAALNELRSARQRAVEALVGAAAHGTDYLELQRLSIELLNDSDPTIRRSAVQVLGHLARRWQALDLQRVIPLLKSASTDPAVASAVGDALDDIDTYMRSRKRGR